MAEQKVIEADVLRVLRERKTDFHPGVDIKERMLGIATGDNAVGYCYNNAMHWLKNGIDIEAGRNITFEKNNVTNATTINAETGAWSSLSLAGGG
jgi:hypothetical protein